jgi:hypothetical protein
MVLWSDHRSSWLRRRRTGSLWCTATAMATAASTASIRWT